MQNLSLHLYMDVAAVQWQTLSKLLFFLVLAFELSLQSAGCARHALELLIIDW